MLLLGSSGTCAESGNTASEVLDIPTEDNYRRGGQPHAESCGSSRDKRAAIMCIPKCLRGSLAYH